MDLYELKKLANDFIESGKSTNTIVLSKDVDIIRFKEAIFEHTRFINPILTKKQGNALKLRLYCLANNITNIPKCQSCDSAVRIHKASGMFGKFCSNVCQAKGNTFNRELIKTEDLIECRKKKMSYDAIGELYGVSCVVIRSICDERGLNFHSLNKTQPALLEQLTNYDFMYDLYKVKGYTCRQISEFLNSSPSEVNKYLNMLGIPPTASNDYERNISKRSVCEIELTNEIKSIVGSDKVLTNKRKLFGGNEIDIYVPSFNFAVEFNGIYWHTFMGGGKGKHYHSNKTKACDSIGVELWHIFEDDWLNETKRDIWLSRIHHKLKSNKIKNIYGRKCTTKKLSVADKQLFFNENHLQGADKAKYYYGLCYEGELVAAMSFSRSRYNKHAVWELSRFAVKKYTNVHGAFRKLLAHFRRECGNGSIVSYADKTYSTGNVYEHNGFILIDETFTDYFYVKNGKRYNKRGFTKSSIKQKLDYYDDSKTEWQNMVANRFDKIWTCGMKTYLLQ